MITTAFKLDGSNIEADFGALGWECNCWAQQPCSELESACFSWGLHVGVLPGSSGKLIIVKAFHGLSR